MKKSFKLDQLGCADCAAKMERKINKLDGVNDAKVNFLFAKLTLDAEDDKFDDVVEQADKIIKKIEPYCSIVR